GAGSGTAANIKGSVTRSRDNYLENRRRRNGKTVGLAQGSAALGQRKATGKGHVFKGSVHLEASPCQ
ncbi:hypothetical protein JTM11_34655, partial [Pseudomonas aeruginosa]|nr:hypothetical protein [Pseudomonas aeruginosa]